MTRCLPLLLPCLAIAAGPAAAGEPTGGLNMAAITGLVQAWMARGSATPAQLTLDVGHLLESPPAGEVSRETAAGKLTLGPAADTGCRPLAQTAVVRGAPATLVATACPGASGWLLKDIRDRDAPAPERPSAEAEAAARSAEPVRLRPLVVAPAWQGGLFEGPAPQPPAPPPPAVPAPTGRGRAALAPASPPAGPPPRQRYCAVAIAFADGATLQFRQSADALTVIFAHPTLAPPARPAPPPGRSAQPATAPRSAPPDPGKRTLHISFDHSTATKVTAAAEGDHLAVTLPAADRALLRGFISAQTLEIGVDPERLLGPYSLKGSQQSLDAMTGCATQELPTKRPGGQG